MFLQLMWTLFSSYPRMACFITRKQDLKEIWCINVTGFLNLHIAFISNKYAIKSSGGIALLFLLPKILMLKGSITYVLIF